MEQSESPSLRARQATVLKCDLVGSTQAKKQLDLEGQFTFKRGFEEIVNRLARRHNAHVDSLEGDGALLVFGFPEPREDAAEAAVRMGLDLVNAFREMEIAPNLRLPLRVGIASDNVAIEHQASGKATIAGLTLDLAERLRERADKLGQVLIADETKHQAGGFFRYRDLGSKQAKGFEEGVRAWEVVCEVPAVSRYEARKSDPSRNEIVGRADILERLSTACKSALGGKGEALCLIGEAGVGKSCLARAALDMAVREGAFKLEIDCTPSTGNTPLFPVSMLLCRAAKIAPASSEEEKRGRAQGLLEQFLPAEQVHDTLLYLAPLFGLQSESVPAGMGPEELRDRTIETVLQMLRSLATARPLALLCEDLHWADGMTAKMLARVCQEIPRLRMLLIVTTRNTSDELPLDLSVFTTIELPPLDPSTAADLVRAIAKDGSLSDMTVCRIVDRCAGIPLLLEEVTRSALEAASRPGEADMAPGLDGQVPAPLQLVVQSRLGRWQQYVPIVEAASVLGREFPVRLIGQIMPGVAQSDVDDAIEIFGREGLFATRSSRFSERAKFKHIMICEAVYNTLLRKDRQNVHSRIADILTADEKGTPDAAPEVVAEHLSKAARYREAIRVRYAASGDTAAQGAYSDADGHCRAALKLLDKLEDAKEREREELRLLIRLGVALTAEHGYSAAIVKDNYERAHALCGDSVEDKYQITRGLATFNLVSGNLRTAHDMSLECFKLAEQSGRAEFLIDAMSLLSYTTVYYGRLDDCRAWIVRCLNLYRKEHGDRLSYPVPQDAGTAAMALMPVVAWLLGDTEACEDAIEKGRAHVEGLDRNFDRALMHAFIGGCRYRQRRYDQSLEEAKKAVEISRRHSYREWLETGCLAILLTKAAQNRDPMAVQQAFDTCLAFAQRGVGLNAPYYLWCLALGYVQAGNVLMAHMMIAEAFRRAELCEEKFMLPELLILQAELDADDTGALQKLEKALALADEQGDIASALRAAAALVLRRKNDDAAMGYAHATFDILDGREDFPAARGWMRKRLDMLRHSANSPPH